jgi:hypothetical protein
MSRLALALVLLSASHCIAETWHDTNGQLIANGTVSSVDSQSIGLQLVGKSTATIQLDDLSLVDRAYLQNRDKADSEFAHPSRQWASNNGSFHVEGKAITFIDDNNLRLARADTKVISIPIAKLSTDDQEYLKRLKEAATTAVVPTLNVAASDSPFSSVEAFSRVNETPSPKTTARAVVRKAAKPTTSVDSMPATSADSVDRNPHGERVTGSTATGIPTFTGPRGGTYHYSASGNKVYSKHK